MTVRFTLEDNRKYWEEANTVSLIDANLHELEMSFVEKFLRPDQVIADLGCGDGEATVRYAAKVKRCYGIERSAQQRARAVRAVAAAKRANVVIVDGDLLDLSAYEGQFDLAITQRVLINFPNWGLQSRAIDNIWSVLKPGGLYVMVENTHDGQNVMNAFREAVGLEPIATHWHNEFLDFDALRAYVAEKFELIERQGFNLYYLLTRVYMQMFASFTGSGRDAKADPIFAKADAAALDLCRKVGDKVVFRDIPVFGPIQGIALVKR